MNEAMKWIDQVRGNDSLRAAARKAAITSAKLIRQVNDDLLAFETVRDVSRAYGRSVLADLVETGHLTIEDAGVGAIERALRVATDSEIVLEVARRLEAVGIHPLFDKPISDAIDQSHADNVRPIKQDVALAASDDDTWQERQERENEN